MFYKKILNNCLKNCFNLFIFEMVGCYYWCRYIVIYWWLLLVREKYGLVLGLSISNLEFIMFIDFCVKCDS